jgi:hypothetical protein
MDKYSTYRDGQLGGRVGAGPAALSSSWNRAIVPRECVADIGPWNRMKVPDVEACTKQGTKGRDQ